MSDDRITERVQSAFVQGFFEAMGSGSVRWLVTMSFEGITLNIKDFDNPVEVVKFVAANIGTPGNKLVVETLSGDHGEAWEPVDVDVNVAKLPVPA